MLSSRGVIPEKLPPAIDVNKVKRKIESEDKKILINTKKINNKSK